MSTDRCTSPVASVILPPQGKGRNDCNGNNTAQADEAAEEAGVVQRAG